LKAAEIATESDKVHILDRRAATPTRDSWPIVVTALIIFVAAAWAIRMASPSDISDGDQMKPAAYIMDVVQGGNWIVQTDFRYAITSKPPLYTWISAFCAMLFGGVTEFSMYLPTGLAMLGTALAAAWIARRWFGNLPAFYAGIFVVLNPLGFRHIAFARTDALFTFFVTMAALFALRTFADRADPKWWLGFWISGAFATLTKGPLGILLAGFGMIAWFWERRRSIQTSTDTSRAELVCVHGIGILIALVLGGVWFALAYRAVGDTLVDKQVTDELVGHALIGFRPMPLVYFLFSLAPWSFLAALGIFRIARAPDTRDETRRAERFLACWIFFGLLLFSLFSHQRHDHLLPLVAPMAILGGREFTRLTANLTTAKQARVAAGVALAGLLVLAGSYGSRTYWYSEAARSEAAIKFAKDVARLEERDGRLLPVTYVSPRETVPYLLGMRHDWAKNSQILEKMLAGGQPVFVSLRSETLLDDVKLPDGGSWHVWFADDRKARIGPILSNVEPGSVPTSGAFVAGDLIIRFENAGYEGPSFGYFRFRPYGRATVSIENTAVDPKTVLIEDMLVGKTFEITVAAGSVETRVIGDNR
jgi:Dolichyl-phosphate-mannose-protein mannosyltransferase